MFRQCLKSFQLIILSGSKILPNLMKNYNEESDEGCFLEVDVQYLEKLQELHNDLPFLPQGMKIKKVEKLVANLHDKPECAIHIRNLKEALNYELVLKKVHKVIKFNQCLAQTTYWYQQRFLKKQKKILKKTFKLMNNANLSQQKEGII